MFIAVLPAASGDSPTSALTEIHDRLGRRGTYAVIVGTSFGAAATRGFPHAAPLAKAAFDAHSGEGEEAVLIDFVDRVADARQSGGAGGGSGYAPIGDGGTGSGSRSGDDGGGSVAPLAILGLLGLGGGALVLNSRRQRRRREERELAEVKHVARDDLVGLGDEIRTLDLDVELPGADPAARADYARAVELYDRANTGFSQARRPADLAPVS